ncbi:PREDICTED: uncharacterized protein LOC106814439 [Priapulus caudatus]|uniref:separase n=1 Tax=Priapulus caudatus TaxID=37621 RepID=A0ABM1EPX1_PRICU|nr:PREDICTED: uncharacterized protein LOC106814439 [Priapulus caudatus]
MSEKAAADNGKQLEKKGQLTLRIMRVCVDKLGQLDAKADTREFTELFCTIRDCYGVVHAAHAAGAFRMLTSLVLERILGYLLASVLKHTQDGRAFKVVDWLLTELSWRDNDRSLREYVVCANNAYAVLWNTAAQPNSASYLLCYTDVLPSLVDYAKLIIGKLAPMCEMQSLDLEKELRFFGTDAGNFGIVCYNRLLYSDAASFLTLACDYIAARYDTLTIADADLTAKSWNKFETLADCHRRLGNFAVALTTIACGAHVTGGAATVSTLDLWAKVKKNAAKQQGGLKIRARTLKDELEDLVEAAEGTRLGDDAVRRLLWMELAAYRRQQQRDTSIETYSVICDLLASCQEEAEEHAGLFVDLAQVLYSANIESEWSAEQCCKEAISLLEPSIPHAASLIAKHHLASAHLWLYVMQSQARQEQAAAKTVATSGGTPTGANDDGEDVASFDERTSSHVTLQQEREMTGALRAALALWRDIACATDDDLRRDLRVTDLLRNLELLAAMFELILEPVLQVETLVLVHRVATACCESARAVVLTNAANLVRALCSVGLVDVAAAVGEKVEAGAEKEKDTEQKETKVARLTWQVAHSEVCYLNEQFDRGWTLLSRVLCCPLLENKLCSSYMIGSSAALLHSRYKALPARTFLHQSTLASLREDDSSPLELGEKGLRTVIGIAKLMLGRDAAEAAAGDDDVACVDRTTRLVTRYRILIDMLCALHQAGDFYLHCGLAREAKTYLKEGLTYAERFGLTKWCARLRLSLCEIELRSGQPLDCELMLDSVDYTLNAEPISAPPLVATVTVATATPANPTTAGRKKKAASGKAAGDTGKMLRGCRGGKPSSGATATPFTIYTDDASAADDFLISSRPLSSPQGAPPSNAAASSPALSRQTRRGGAEHAAGCACARCGDVALQLLNALASALRARCLHDQSRDGELLAGRFAAARARAAAHAHVEGATATLRDVVVERLGVAPGGAPSGSVLAESGAAYHVVVATAQLRGDDIGSAEAELARGQQLLAGHHGELRARLLHLEAVLSIRKEAEGRACDPYSLFRVGYCEASPRGEGSTRVSLEAVTMTPAARRARFLSGASSSPSTTRDRIPSIPGDVKPFAQQQCSPSILTERNNVIAAYKTPARKLKPRRRRPAVRQMAPLGSDSDSKENSPAPPRPCRTGHQRAPRKPRAPRRTNLNPVREPESESEDDVATETVRCHAGAPWRGRRSAAVVSTDTSFTRLSETEDVNPSSAKSLAPKSLAAKSLAAKSPRSNSPTANAPTDKSRAKPAKTLNQTKAQKRAGAKKVAVARPMRVTRGQQLQQQHGGDTERFRHDDSSACDDDSYAASDADDVHVAHQGAPDATSPDALTERRAVDHVARQGAPHEVDLDASVEVARAASEEETTPTLRRTKRGRPAGRGKATAAGGLSAKGKTATEKPTTRKKLAGEEATREKPIREKPTKEEKPPKKEPTREKSGRGRRKNAIDAKQKEKVVAKSERVVEEEEVKAEEVEVLRSSSVRGGRSDDSDSFLRMSPLSAGVVRHREFSVASVKLLLDEATSLLRQHPPSPLYGEVMLLRALCDVTLDPRAAARHAAEAAAVTLRHQACLQITKKLRKLAKEEKSPGDLESAFSAMRLDSMKTPTAAQLSSAKELLRFGDASPADADFLPRGWTVCQLSVVPSQHPAHPPNLIIVRFRRQGEPLVARVAMAIGEQGYDILEEYLSIQKASSTTAGVTDKATWWGTRHTLDERMQYLMQQMENLWLGGYKGMLLGCHVNKEDAERLRKASKELMMTFSICLPSSSLPLLQMLIDSPSNLEPKQLSLIITDVTGLPSNNKSHNAIYRQIRKLSRELNLKVVTRDTTVLILDKSVQHLPWESLSILRTHPVSRMPSLHFIRSSVAAQGSQPAGVADQGSRPAGAICREVDVRNTFYVLNPANDLPNTQTTFQAWFDREKSWRGVVGQPPTPDEFREALTDFQHFVYCGHGTGGRYLRGDDIQRIDCRAVALLMGCSSGRLAVAGQLDACGMVLNYLIAGCPCIVANLWDVTDRDIDRFLEKLLRCWLPSDGRTTVLQHMSEARGSCKLKHMIGAAPVVYGLPVRTKSS